LQKDVERLKCQHPQWLEIDISKYHEVQITTLHSINATMAPYPVQRVISDGGKLWNASILPHFDV